MADDMDIDIDFANDPDMQRFEEEEARAQEVQPVQPTTATAQDVQSNEAIPEAYRDDFDADLPAREKIHLRGLDNLNPEELQHYLGEHYTANPHKRIEWINDTSANIIYHHPDHAKEALISLSANPDASLPTTEMRPAKPSSMKPDVELFVRQALVSDKKIQNARLYSKFYLQNPDYDPEMRESNPRYDRRGRGGRSGGGRREREPVPKSFTTDMYDDPVEADTEMDRSRGRSGEPRGKRRRQGDEDLFTKRDTGRLRDRTRSPLRDGDGDGRYGFGEDQPVRKTARRRSFTPPAERRKKDEPMRDSAPRELFPNKTSSTAATALTSGNNAIELFPDHGTKRSRELFPHRTSHSNHRRSDAMDPREAADFISPERPRTLADRITGGPATNGHNGSNGFSFKGAAENEAPGFSIRGASREVNSKVKELFPSKVADNTGKELFPGGTRRGGPRRRAEELL